MKDARPEEQVDEILSSLHEGLKKAEEALSTMLEEVASGNATAVADLEAALAHVEEVVAAD